MVKQAYVTNINGNTEKYHFNNLYELIDKINLTNNLSDGTFNYHLRDYFNFKLHIKLYYYKLYIDKDELYDSSTDSYHFKESDFNDSVIYNITLIKMLNPNYDKSFGAIYDFYPFNTKETVFFLFNISKNSLNDTLQFYKVDPLSESNNFRGLNNMTRRLNDYHNVRRKLNEPILSSGGFIVNYDHCIHMSQAAYDYKSCKSRKLVYSGLLEIPYEDTRISSISPICILYKSLLKILYMKTINNPIALEQSSIHKSNWNNFSYNHKEKLVLTFKSLLTIRLISLEIKEFKKYMLKY